MDALQQFWVFALCVAFGLGCGLVYEAFALVAFPFCRRGKRRWVRAIIDVVYFALIAVLAVWWAYVFRYPSFRTFMWIGYALGGIIYLKTLRRIVAFCKKVCYNNIVKRRLSKKNRTKSSREEKSGL